MSHGAAQYKNGFTLIELLLVITIIGIITIFATVGFRNYAAYQNYNFAVEGVLATLSEARTAAQASADGLARGVKVESDRLIIFKGSVYSSVDSTNVSYIYDAVTLTPTISGGGSQIVFSPLTGLPEASGTITVDGTIHADSRTITISASGVVQ